MRLIKILLYGIVLFSMAVVGFAADAPQLDLKMRKVECAPDLTGWRYQITNNGTQPVSLSDLEIHLWIHGVGPIAAQSWVPGDLVDDQGADIRSVNEVSVLTKEMPRFMAYPLNEKADNQITINTTDQGLLPAGGKWQDGFIEYYLVNWGPLAQGQDYSSSTQCGDQPPYFENPTVGLYYRGNLLSEWTGLNTQDTQTGLNPLPSLDLTGTPSYPTQIISPSDGEEVYGLVGIAARPQASNWEIQWASQGSDNWSTLSAGNQGDHWSASWDTTVLQTGVYRIRLWDTDKGAEVEKITVQVQAPQFQQSYSLPNSGVPGGLAFSGGLDVLDQKNQVIQGFNAAGVNNETLGGYGNRLGEMYQALGLTADSTGNLYVADTGNGRVEEFGNTDSLLGTGIITSPTAVVSTGSGLYVLDGKFVHRFDASGNYLYSGRLDITGSYADIAVDDSGLVYVVNSLTRGIDIYTPDFASKHSWLDPSGKWNPTSLSYSSGRLWMTDGAGNQIVKLGLDGNRLETWGGYGSSSTQFDQPLKVTLDGQGGIYVSDVGNSAVKKFSQTVAVVTGTPTPNTGGTLQVQLTADPSLFDPGQTSTTLNYTLSMNANAALVITNGSGSIVLQQAYTTGSFGGNQGQNQVVWNGLTNGTPLPDGSYTATLNASANGQQATVQTVIIIKAGIPTATPTPVITPLQPTPTFTPVAFTPTPTVTDVVVPPTATLTPVIVDTGTPTAVPPTATDTAVPPTSTATPIPPTSTFTPVPPTATPTAVPPTATFTAVPPTETFTPVPKLDLSGLDIHPDSFGKNTNPKVITGTFTLNIPASVEIKVVKSTGQVYSDMVVSGSAGNNNFTISSYSSPLGAGSYQVVVTATAGSQTATATDAFTVNN